MCDYYCLSSLSTNTLVPHIIEALHVFDWIQSGFEPVSFTLIMLQCSPSTIMLLSILISDEVSQMAVVEISNKSQL